MTMQGQISTQTKKVNEIMYAQQYADHIGKALSDVSKKSHNGKSNKKYQTTKRDYIKRRQREYEVEYTIDKDGGVEFWSIDGNPDVEDTYSESFLAAIEEQIIELIKEGDDSDDDYDDMFQNQESPWVQEEK